MTESTTLNKAEFLETVDLALRVKQSLLRLARRLGMTDYTIGEIVDCVLLAATSIADTQN
jgi:hypothetical protein